MRSTPEPEPLISLGLSASTAMPHPSPLPDAETLQFQKAETNGEGPGASMETCSACRRPITDLYFWANGAKVCSPCGLAIQTAQQAPRPHLFLKAFVWGAGAALAGTILYATVTIVTGFQLALISILIGYMVGKAILHACQGRGGRPQQSWLSS